MAKIIKEPVCLTCKHFIVWGSCGAFPDGIPKEITMGENNHTKPYPGDDGIQYEPINESED